ncbi:LutB/LldF family L-lactate oxidation iron-sulfur protein [Saccharothrix algeriensis]|uniref:Iron-sulfur cluster-binding protein n=1 Tax=Saccharothrix algeriensis TaxID=173560 RepID=A0A8T8I561_9PSEU|nr:LutB/LldF family L-lactate oxidation iron-sulfur protein [Saccharothrix algeriensis]MBM7812108.1 L-lactate dehydrogenase complex protein LldF [Saccharothrix algeriensis]QTR05771.1 iron-sulfur cluster-binding protein [Saccharothrix algeriensis]
MGARNPVTWLGSPAFPEAARAALADTQLRRNLRNATTTIRGRRAEAVGELPDWEELRRAGEAIKDEVLHHLDTYLERLEAAVVARGGVVHWARDAAEANAVVRDLVGDAEEVVKVKSMATAEIGLNEALEAAGVRAVETDLAELIVQLGHDRPSHILVPAIHRNRAEIRAIFRSAGIEADSDDPRALAEAARAHLRRKFLSCDVAISGANFAVADTGSVVVLESEGNGRMCLTLPKRLITVMGIEKVVPTWQDLEVFLQLLPRSSTAERMNPYTSVWTGVAPGDGPQEFHLVLLDNGRSRTLADPVGRQALRCIRCSACLNACPVYERTGGRSYGSVYPGPIGAILTPQLVADPHDEQAASLPFASSLCGACFEVCPVRIDIPEVLTHLRAEVVAARGRDAESVAMAAAAWVFASPERYERAQRLGSLVRFLARDGRLSRLPGPGAAWTSSRDAPVPARESFRQWWRRNRG